MSLDLSPTPGATLERSSRDLKAREEVTGSLVLSLWQESMIVTFLVIRQGSQSGDFTLRAPAPILTLKPSSVIRESVASFCRGAHPEEHAERNVSPDRILS